MSEENNKKQQETIKNLRKAIDERSNEKIDNLMGNIRSLLNSK